MPATNPYPAISTPGAVSSRVTGLLKTDSPLMKQARTTGLKAANRRGLLNSSIAVGAAEDAAIRQALPIATADADIASRERQGATQAALGFEQTYAEQFRTIASNHNLPAATRNQYLEHLAALRDSNMNLVEQLYGIDLDWGTPGSSGTPSLPVAEPAIPRPFRPKNDEAYEQDGD